MNSFLWLSHGLISTDIVKAANIPTNIKRSAILKWPL
jgi:hypothetical protein